GMFYKGKTVVVVGGGNTAAADALLLSRVAEKVYLVHRRDALRATKIYHNQLEAAENVELCWMNTVTELLHDGRITGVRLKNEKTGEMRQIACDGVFISIGRKPATEFLAGKLELDANGYVVAGEDTMTSVPGVFAVGDLRTKPLRQVVTAVADGAAAVTAAEEYLAEYK
ncbi:MAG: FAD-dependent oxidoreductase, partial [Clostridia bacterium]|nr:FAD-dependent oxidoreductase [Clostridia bacterium]